MPVTPCPPRIPTAKAPLAIELRYRNNLADPNPLADWSRYTEAAKLQLYPAGSEWGVLHERLSAREVQRSFDDPSHPDLKLIEEWHRLTVHAKLDENGTTLRIEIKLETGTPGPNGEPPTTYTTAYQGHDVLELPHEAGWQAAEYPPTQDESRPAQCTISLGPISSSKGGLF